MRVIIMIGIPIAFAKSGVGLAADTANPNVIAVTTVNSKMSKK